MRPQRAELTGAVDRRHDSIQEIHSHLMSPSWRPGSFGGVRKGVHMEQALGIGGVFFKTRDPKAIAAWYRGHLGVPVEPGQIYGAFTYAGAGEQAAWSVFPADTTYFGSGPAPFMINYRVRNLDAMLAQLRAAGAQVDDRVDDYDFGRFGWATDPKGNRFELWEPRLPEQG